MRFFVTLCLFVLSRMCVYAQVIVTVAGTGMGGYSGDGGPATNATMKQANDLAFDKDGNFYFSDDGVPRIRKVTSTGIITTVAGNGTSGYCCDGFPATLAQLKGGGGIAVDKWNNIYYTDGSDHRVRKITADGIIHTIAGTGVAGYNGDGIPATDAQLNIPEGIAVDDTGNVYIGDRLNYRIRKINTSGIITTIAGKGVAAFTPDGALADTSAIIGVSCLIVDNLGNVFLPDNNRIRKIVNGTGVLTTVAGNGTSGYSGDGGSATLASISTIRFTVDSVGNLYLSDGAAERIRKVSTDGTISTVAGKGGTGLENDGAPVLLARLHTPCGIAFSPAGELHYADKSSARIRKITLAWDVVIEVSNGNSKLELYPNPVHGVVNVRMNVTAKEANLTIRDISGVVVRTMMVPCNVINEIDVNGLQPGTYTVKMIAGSDEVSQQLIVK
jgi:sugar lactone lactonase YvrE